MTGTTGPLPVLTYGIAFLWTVLLPGIAVRRVVLGRARSWPEELFLGGTIGLAVQLLLWFPCVLLGQPRLMAAAPLALLVPLVAHPRTRTALRQGPTGATHPLVWLGLLAVWAWLAAQLLHQMRMAAPLPATRGPWYVDLPWHLALMHESTRAVPLLVPQLGEGVLHYHWFSDAHIAATASTLGTDLPVALVRLWFLPVVLLTLLGTHALAARLTSRAWPGLLATVLLVLPGVVSVIPWLPTVGTFGFVPLSPSGLYGHPLLIGVVMLVLDAAERRVRRPGWALLAVLAFAAAGAKSSNLPVLLPGVALALVLCWRDRATRWRLAGALGLLLAVFVVAAKLLAGGSSGSRPGFGAIVHYFMPTGDGTSSGPAGAAVWGLLVAAVLQVAPSLLVLSVADRRRLTAPALPLLVGVSLASLGGLLAIDHMGWSQGYFMRGSMPFLAALAAWGLHGLVEPLRDPEQRPAQNGTPTAVVIGAGLGSALLCLLARALAGGQKPRLEDSVARIAVPAAVGLLWVLLVAALAWRAGVKGRGRLLAASAGVALVLVALVPWTDVPEREQRPTGDALSAERDAAARWMGEHMPGDALVATNTYCAMPPSWPCQSVGWFVSGNGGRRTYLEGWAYTDENQSDRNSKGHLQYLPFWDPARKDRNDAIFLDPSSQAVATLKAAGVDYVLADTAAGTVSPALDGLADVERVFQQGTVSIYRVR